MKTAIAALMLALVGVAPTAGAQTLKVCAGNDDLPYANAKGEGFEDRIASLLGDKLGMSVERVGFTDPRYVVRDLLDKQACDVIIGVDQGDPRLDTTPAYYRSSYVFVTREKDGLEIKDWRSEPLQTRRLGVIPGTPAEVMVTQIGRYPDTFAYMMGLGGNKSMRNRFVRYDPAQLIADLRDDKIDVVIAWAPAVARYIGGAGVPLKPSPVPAVAHKSNGEPVNFTFDTALGVRKGNDELLRRLQGVLERNRTDIDGILRSEGIPITAPTVSQASTPAVAAHEGKQ